MNLSKLAIGIALGLLCTISGCVTEVQVSRPSSRMNPVANGSPPGTPGSPGTPNSQQNMPEFKPVPGSSTRTLDLRVAVSLLGSVSYDNFILPMVSPDGHYLATQTGIAPTLATTLAATDAAVPLVTRVEIYELDLRVGIEQQDRRPARHVVTLDEPVMLGRSCDDRGFLIESQRENGTRWIGRADWQTGKINWLVNDESVNAFASLGPNGRLAWSRRNVEGGRFELVVRVNNSEYTMTSVDTDWVYPSWSGHADGLFVMTLREGLLEMTHALAYSEPAFQQSQRRIPLARNANIYTAHQTLSTRVEINSVSMPSPRFDQIAFIHPSHARASVWRPLSPTPGPAILYQGSFAALADDSDIAFVSTPKNLKRQSLMDPRINANILAGTLIPRSIGSPNWHYVLLAPGQGSIGLSVARLLGPER